jgi:hypothetical protein
MFSRNLIIKQCLSILDRVQSDLEAILGVAWSAAFFTEPEGSVLELHL